MNLTINTGAARRPVGVLLCTLLWALPGLAAQPREAIEDALDPYPRSETVGNTTTTVADYRLATGAVRKVGGRWVSEQELRKSGELRRITLQIPEGHRPREVFQYYRQQLANLDARAIYLCRQRDCGSSNSWANDVFEIRQLYGLDQDQYYGIFEVTDDQDRLSYVVVYTVARGNQRVYAHLEWLQTDEQSTAGVAPNPDAIIEQLREQGYYSVSGIRLEGGELVFDAEHITALADALRSNPRLSLRIVGHDYSGRPLQAQIERSQSHAQELVEKLVEAGVKEDRLEAHGVGSLVPTRITARNRERDHRLELVVAE